MRKQCELDAAIELYSIAMVLAPGKAEIKIGLGQILQSAQRFDLAIDFYREILAYEPDNFEIRSSLGTAYMQKNLFADAEREFDIVGKAKPDYIPMLVDKALLYARTERRAKAIATLRRAELLAPSDQNVKKFLAELLKQD